MGFPLILRRLLLQEFLDVLQQIADPVGNKEANATHKNTHITEAT
jgi:hypothetical protein